MLFMRLMYPLVWMFGHFTSWVHRLSGGQEEPTVTESELIGMLGIADDEAKSLMDEANERAKILLDLDD